MPTETASPKDFFNRVLLPNLSEKELYELFCLIDEGQTDELHEILGDFSRRNFPEDFDLDQKRKALE